MIPSSFASKFTGEFGFVRIMRKRSTSGGSRFAISRADAPTPRELLIFAPPTRKNSYGTLSGGSLPKIARRHAALTSREPPLVEWSLPAPSIVTGNVTHLATHSSFHG